MVVRERDLDQNLQEDEASTEREPTDEELLALAGSQEELLSWEQEVFLAQTMEQGKLAQARLNQNPNLDTTNKADLLLDMHKGKDARRLLIEHNVGLAAAIAKKYIGRGLEWEDLKQEAVIGLMNGVDRFDWKRNFRLATSTAWWIRKRCGLAIANQGRTIRLPVYLVQELSQFLDVSRNLQQQLGRKPTNEELATAMNLPVEKIKHYQKSLPGVVSLNLKVRNGDCETEIGELIEDRSSPTPDPVQTKEIRWERLGEREIRVLVLRYYDGLTTEEAGKELGVSRQRASQIEIKALRKLRQTHYP